MARRFTRSKTREQELEDQFLNSFYKGGFIDEKIIHNNDRDFWEAYKDMMSDVNSSGIYESILLATKEEDYREDVLQRLILKEYDDAKLYAHEYGEEVFVSTTFRPYRFVRCLFIHNPMSYIHGDRKREILNTLKMIPSYEQEGFVINEKVKTFLQQQAQLQHYSDPDTEDENRNAHLFVTSGRKEDIQIVTVLVPFLEDGLYYNINDILNYPYITENYHYYKSKVGQIKFSFKIKYSNKKSRKGVEVRKCTGYFSYGWDTTDPEFQGRNMFYTAFFKQYYNPFLLFEPQELTEMIEDLYFHYDLTDETKELIANTMAHYNKYYVPTREHYGNRVPSNIQIHNPQDNYFDIFKSEDLIEDGEEEEDDEIEEDDNEVEELEEEEEVQDVKKFSVNRTVLSIHTLKSLILGHNDVKYYGFYGHLADTMLKITDLNNSGIKRRDGNRVNLKFTPRSQQIIKTINSNPDLFCSNTMHCCLDVFYLAPYRKNLYDLDTSNGAEGSTGKAKIKMEDRFLRIGYDFGSVDSVTVKSAKTSGIQGNKSMLAHYRKDMEYRRG